MQKFIFSLCVKKLQGAVIPLLESLTSSEIIHSRRRFLHMKRLNENQLKEIYFNQLFQDNKCSNTALHSFITRQQMKYKGHHNAYMISNESIFWAYKAVMRFTIQDDSSWEDMINGSDKLNIGKLIKNIKRTISNELIRSINDDTKIVIERDASGQILHSKYKTAIQSLDAESEKEVRSVLLELVSNNQSYWSSSHTENKTAFSEWFWANYTKFLTASQVKLINAIKKMNHETADNYYSNDLEKYINFSAHKLSEYFKRIAERTERAYLIECKTFKKTYLQANKEKQQKLWQQLLFIAYEADIAPGEVNKQASDWIINNLDNEYVSNLIYDSITGQDIKSVVNAYKTGDQIASTVLYKILDAVDNKLYELDLFNTQAVAFTKKPEEILNNWDQDKIKDHAQKMAHFKSSTVKLYKKLSDGSLSPLLAEDAYKPIQKAEIIKYITPLGATVSRSISDHDL